MFRTVARRMLQPARQIIRPQQKIIHAKQLSTPAFWRSSYRSFVLVRCEDTPNPESMIITPEGKSVLGAGSKTRVYQDKYSSNDAPLAQALFRVYGVKTVMLTANAVTVTKEKDVTWDLVKPNLELVMSQFFSTDMPAAYPDAEEEKAQKEAKYSGDQSEVIAQILEVLEERVRPFVQSDGGDVEFVKFEKGVVWLQLQGACQGCPKSSITLQHGIKGMMKHMVPEVEDVQAIPDEGVDESLFPDPHKQNDEGGETK